jgi:WD40 repeat protein
VRGVGSLVAFSPNNRYLALGGPRGDITFWDLEAKKATSIWGELLRDRITAIAFSPDGKYLAAGGALGNLWLFNTKWPILGINLEGNPRSVSAIAFSPDSRLLACAGGGDLLGGKDTPDDNLIRFWDITTKKTVAVVEKLPRRPAALAFSPDGKTLVSAGYDKLIRFWDVESKKEVGEVSGDATCLAYSPDGQPLASGCRHELGLRLWDPKERKEIRSIQIPGQYVHSLAFSPDGKTILTGGDSQTLHLWELATGQEVHAARGTWAASSR